MISVHTILEARCMHRYLKVGKITILLRLPSLVFILKFLYELVLAELEGIPPETIRRLIPEHARRQNLFMALHS